MTKKPVDVTFRRMPMDYGRGRDTATVRQLSQCRPSVDTRHGRDAEKKNTKHACALLLPPAATRAARNTDAEDEGGEGRRVRGGETLTDRACRRRPGDECRRDAARSFCSDQNNTRGNIGSRSSSAFFVVRLLRTRCVVDRRAMFDTRHRCLRPGSSSAPRRAQSQLAAATAAVHRSYRACPPPRPRVLWRRRARFRHYASCQRNNADGGF